MQRILLLDNFDSFSYNLFHYLEGLGVKVDVVRADQLENDPNDYDKIIFSPGPGLPVEDGIMHRILEQVDGARPILGVCLGMQAIGLFLGGEIYNQPTVKHGVQESIGLLKCELFEGIQREIKVGLYHSWALKNDVGDFSQTAFSDSNIVMAISNTGQKLYGVQFHPESIMTPCGKQILENFLGLE